MKNRGLSPIFLPIFLFSSDSDAGRAWRTRVIYETNLRTAYMAGRWQQVQAVKKHRPYLIYRHSDSVTTAHPEHLAWDGLVVRVDDPWVKTHWPPNGYGCRCGMDTLSEADLKKLGKTGPDTPPDDGTYDWTDPKTGETHTFPKGIGPFWDYAPGASVADRVKAQIKRKLPGLPDGVAKELGALIKSGPAAEAERAALGLGVKTVDYAQRADIAATVNQALAGFAAKGLPVPETVRVEGAAFETWATRLDANPADLAAAFVPHKLTGATYLLVNPGYAFWHNPGKDAAHQFALGEWSTDAAHHTINHEMGHFLHYSADRVNYRLLQASGFQPAEAAVAARVSRYASEAPLEFVAEVFAALLAGRTFDDGIMALYRTLKGPMP